MFQTVRISALSYSNTYPFVFGLQKMLAGKIGDIRYEVPAVSAERFKKKEVDVALIPVGALSEMEDYQIVTDFCIGSDGPVKTVCLYHNEPLESLTTIYLDTESRTSVRLVKILARHHWNIHPRWTPAQPGIAPRKGEGVLLIGDKTFGMARNYRYCTDLSTEWKKMTGLPFVFAVWVAKPHVSQRFISELNKALRYGVENLAQVYSHFKITIPESEFVEYIERYIAYHLDNKKREAIKLFLKLDV